MNCSAPELHFSSRFFGSWLQKRRIASGPILVPEGRLSTGLDDAWGKDYKNEGTLWLERIARRDRYSGNTSHKITEFYTLVEYGS